MLYVVDDAPPLVHDLRHGREIGIHQNEMGYVPRRIASRSDGDRTVSFLQCEDIVDAVARHGDSAPG